MMIALIHVVDILRTLRKLGALGLILLGFTDGSLMPLPGSMDALTIVLAARHHDLWFYYAVMATIGSTIGGSLTYRFALKRGKSTLIRRLGEERTQRLCLSFACWGYWAVAVPAMLPPPFPVVPSLLAAGATHYPKGKFVGALASGRAVKFTLLAFLASLYGRRTLIHAQGYYQSLLVWLLIGAAAIGVSTALYWFYRKQSSNGRRNESDLEVPEAIPLSAVADEHE